MRLPLRFSVVVNSPHGLVFLGAHDRGTAGCACGKGRRDGEYSNQRLYRICGKLGGVSSKCWRHSLRLTPA